MDGLSQFVLHYLREKRTEETLEYVVLDLHCFFEMNWIRTTKSARFSDVGRIFSSKNTV